MSDALFSDRLSVPRARRVPPPAWFGERAPATRRRRLAELPGALALGVLGGIVVGACLLAIAVCFLPA